VPWVLLEPLTLIASGLPLPATQAAPPLLRFQVQLPFVFWPGKAQEGRGGAGRGRGLWGRGEEETRRAPGEPLSRSQPQLRVLALVKHKKMRAVTRHGEAAQRAHPALNWPDCATPLAKDHATKGGFALADHGASLLCMTKAASLY